MNSHTANHTVRSVHAWPLPNTGGFLSPRAPGHLSPPKRLSREALQATPSLVSPKPLKVTPKTESDSSMNELDLLLGIDVTGSVKTPKVSPPTTARRAALTKQDRSLTLQRSTTTRDRTERRPSDTFCTLSVFCQPFSAEQRVALANEFGEETPRAKAKKHPKGERPQSILDKLNALERDARFFAICRDQASVLVQPKSSGPNGIQESPARVLDPMELPELSRLARRMIEDIDHLISDVRKAGKNPSILVETRERMAKALREANQI